MTDWEYKFISEQRVARLATVDANGQPAVIPIVYAFDGVALFTPLDAKPKRVAAAQLQRVRNINVNPHVAVIIDSYSEDWRRLAWVHVRGRARIITEGDRVHGRNHAPRREISAVRTYAARWPPAYNDRADGYPQLAGK